MRGNHNTSYAKMQMLRKLKKNMALFGKVCFPSAFQKATPPFHSHIYKALVNDSKKRVLVAAPRGSAKSTVSTLVLPLFQAAFKTDKEDKFIVIISESQAQSINFLSRIKYHLTYSSNYKRIFGDMGPTTAKRWTTTDVVLSNGTRIVAVGTGQRVRGFIEGDTRPTHIIVDDFESEHNALTFEARKKNRDWMTEAVIPSLSDDGRIIMIGTVISEDCFLYWAKDSPAWHTLWFSIVDDEGNPIWPERFPLSRVESIKQEYASVGNLTGFYQEYMNVAQAPDDAPFKPVYIKTYDMIYKRENGQNFLEKKNGDKIPIDIYCGIDPASSLSIRADFFVIATIGVDSDNNKYIIDIFRKRIDPAIQPDKIIETYKKYKPRRVKIETVAYQEALRSAVRKVMSEEGLFIPGLEKGVKPRTRKSERLISLVPMFAKGEFFFRKEDVIAQEEFLSYPRGKNDDIMDAIWTALETHHPCRKKSFVELDKKIKKKSKKLDWMTM
jgi:predicted phage terminase large subunit-like protein